MDSERLKGYLQNYLDTVLTDRLNQKLEENNSEPVSVEVHSVRKGSYQPPIYHVFIDTEPIIKKTYGMKPFFSMILSSFEKDVSDFFKVLSINNKVKIHWNKRPLFNNETLSADD